MASGPLRFAATVVAALFVALPASAVVTEHTVGGRTVVVVRPDGAGPWPAVYALPGLGEMVRGDRASAWGWVERYGLREAMDALGRPRLEAADLQGLATGAELDAWNARRAGGWTGLVVVCPATPRRLTPSFEAWLVGELIPWAEATLPVKRGPAWRGLDGISLGGRHALRIGFSRPEAFRSVGSSQAAVKDLVTALARKAAAQARAMAHLHVNLLTSQGDPFRDAVSRLAVRLRAAGVRVHLAVTRGGHDKRFAKGPGVLDMLLFHDMVLNRAGDH